MVGEGSSLRLTANPRAFQWRKGKKNITVREGELLGKHSMKEHKQDHRTVQQVVGLKRGTDKPNYQLITLTL
jgi:hypothetical protein